MSKKQDIINEINDLFEAELQKDLEEENKALRSNTEVYLWSDSSTATRVVTITDTVTQIF